MVIMPSKKVIRILNDMLSDLNVPSPMMAFMQNILGDVLDNMSDKKLQKLSTDINSMLLTVNGDKNIFD